MKLEIIKTDGYIFVVDNSEIKEDDWVYNGIDFYQVERSPLYNIESTAKKIIAHLSLGMHSNLEGVPLLPPLDFEDDVEVMAEEKWKSIGNTGNATPTFQNGYGSGYYKAKQKYKFTQEDVIKAIEMAREGITVHRISEWETEKEFDYNDSQIIEFLSQPKVPTHFEFELEKDYRYNDDGEPIGLKVHDSIKIKTTINSQGQAIACGKYIHEV